MESRGNNETADTNASKPLELFGDLQRRNERRARIARLLATQRERRRLTVERAVQAKRKHPLHGG
jgi:hypothetical protein